MYQRILVPYDGSPTSAGGLDEALRLAQLTGATIRLLHMVDLLVMAVGLETPRAYFDEVLPVMRRAGEKVLKLGRARIEAAGVKAETILVDRVAARLCDMVAEQIVAWHADLVVIGTHGRRGVSRLLLGSDAEQIVRTALVPVLLVKAAPASAAAPVRPAADAAWATAGVVPA